MGQPITPTKTRKQKQQRRQHKEHSTPTKTNQQEQQHRHKQPSTPTRKTRNYHSPRSDNNSGKVLQKVVDSSNMPDNTIAVDKNPPERFLIPTVFTAKSGTKNMFVDPMATRQLIETTLASK